MPDRLFDLFICVLLVVTIAHLFVVQRRLRAFRAERDRLQAFVTALDVTVERAEAAIRRLKQAQAPAAEPSAPSPKVLRQRTPEELMEAAALASPARRKPNTAASTVPPATGKAGLGALLKSLAGQG
jgi:hypothetical protein